MNAFIGIVPFNKPYDKVLGASKKLLSISGTILSSADLHKKVVWAAVTRTVGPGGLLSKVTPE